VIKCSSWNDSPTSATSNAPTHMLAASPADVRNAAHVARGRLPAR
jgi:hypothetical protein